MTPDSLEQAAGDRLRLQEYSDNFLSDASAGELAMMFAETQPPLHVSVLILRQWYTRYHPDSGALSYDTVNALEEALGDVLRSQYVGMGYRDLRTTLGKRRKADLVSKQVCQQWCKKHASASSSVSTLGKRSAPVQLPEPPCKRRVVMKTVLSNMYPMHLHGPDDVEEAVGHRYRAEASPQQ